jgi:dimethylglycine dehydrogenase
MLNRRGRIEAGSDTSCGWREDRFYLVCAAFFEQRLIDHLAFARRAMRTLTSSTARTTGPRSLNGPKSRDILGACTDAALDNASFRWLSAQEITVAGHRMWAFRMSYAGELGWELHMPARAHAGGL